MALREKGLRFMIYKYTYFDKSFRGRIEKEKHIHQNMWYLSFSDYIN